MPASAPSPVARFHQMPSRSAGRNALAASEKDAPVMTGMASGAAKAAHAASAATSTMAARATRMRRSVEALRCRLR